MPPRGEFRVFQLAQAQALATELPACSSFLCMSQLPSTGIAVISFDKVMICMNAHTSVDRILSNWGVETSICLLRPLTRL